MGMLVRKDKDLNVKKRIALPLAFGLSLFFGSIFLYGIPTGEALPYTSWSDLAYIACTFIGTVMIHVALDNASKIISSNLGKDKWNLEGESFMQDLHAKVTPYSVNIPSRLYGSEEHTSELQSLIGN